MRLGNAFGKCVWEMRLGVYRTKAITNIRLYGGNTRGCKRGKEVNDASCVRAMHASCWEETM
jgi:hypothetical protein